MLCEEWGNLVKRYRYAVSDYNDAVQELDSVPGARFDQTWQRAEKAKAQVETSRANLFCHEHEHRCLLGRMPPTTEKGAASEGIEALALATRQLSGD